MTAIERTFGTTSRGRGIDIAQTARGGVKYTKTRRGYLVENGFGAAIAVEAGEIGEQPSRNDHGVAGSASTHRSNVVQTRPPETTES